MRDVIRMIERDGWRFDRQRGSHRVYKHPSKPGTVVMVGKRGDDVPVGTLGNIMRQAGLRRSKGRRQ